MTSFKIAILDDEPEMLESYRRIIRACGHEAILIRDPQQVRDIVSGEQPDAFLADLQLPRNNGLAVLRQLRELLPMMPVIVFTAQDSVESAVECIKAGAFDYVVKPFTIEQFKIVIARALEGPSPMTSVPAVVCQSKALKENLMIGESAQMQKLGELIRKVARTDSNVLIQGESGTGKEVVAHRIHASSSRAQKPFVPLDCASIPESLLESELFGYQKGAFTGATSNKPGLFETANGGSIFLDEIGEMPLSLQSKLLRVLQERTYRRVGDTELRSTNVRVIAATNRDLDIERRNKRFREDLYYRLGVITLEVPALRQRSSDVPLLADHFARLFAKRSGIEFSRISTGAMDILETYAWPGNVRELQNVIERAITLGSGAILTPNDLPDNIRNGEDLCIQARGNGLDFKRAKDFCIVAFEREYLAKLLDNSSYNLSKVARLSGLSRRTIYRLMKKHHIYNKRAMEEWGEMPDEAGEEFAAELA